MCGEDQRDGEQGQTGSRAGSSGPSTKPGESGVDPGNEGTEIQRFCLGESEDCRMKGFEGLVSGLEIHVLTHSYGFSCHLQAIRMGRAQGFGEPQRPWFEYQFCHSTSVRPLAGYLPPPSVGLIWEMQVTVATSVVS